MSLAILEKEECNADQGDLHLMNGICLYHLKRLEETRTELSMAIDDDEDYAEEARAYLRKIS